jgi:hypothetical protein
MNDTGAIYTLGTQGTDSIGSRTRINDNYIINYRKRLGAIYLDQGSSNIDIEKNVIELASPLVLPDDEFVNWFTYSGYDTHNIYCNNNYFSQNYPTPLTRPIFPPLSPPKPLPTNINISSSNNLIINPANSSIIIQQSGIQQTKSCQ